MRSWLVAVGPNPGRGSSTAHGPVTNTGPVRVVPAEDMVEVLDGIKTLLAHDSNAERIDAYLQIWKWTLEGEFDD
jgi:hypothetical protein